MASSPEIEIEREREREREREKAGWQSGRQSGRQSGWQSGRQSGRLAGTKRSSETEGGRDELRRRRAGQGAAEPGVKVSFVKLAHIIIDDDIYCRFNNEYISKLVNLLF